MLLTNYTFSLALSAITVCCGLFCNGYMASKLIERYKKWSLKINFDGALYLIADDKNKEAKFECESIKLNVQNIILQYMHHIFSSTAKHV